MGGVTSANLVDDKMPQMNDLSTTNNVSTGHLGSQRFAKIAGEILPVTSIFLDVMNGDTIAQAITVRTDGKVNNITFTFHDNKNNLHHVVPADVDQLEAGVYRASARYTFNVDGKLRALDLMDVKVDGATYIDLASPYVGLVQSGGVNGNLLTNIQVISPTTQANGIATYTASGNRSLFDMLRWQITQFAPHTQYRISFTARGKGTLVSHIYPGAAVIEDGREDGKKSYTLNDDWKTFTCDFTSKDTLSGDIVKNMIFRFYEGTDDVELQVDLSSVCLQKVGG